MQTVQIRKRNGDLTNSRYHGAQNWRQCPSCNGHEVVSWRIPISLARTVKFRLNIKHLFVSMWNKAVPTLSSSFKEAFPVLKWSLATHRCLRSRQRHLWVRFWASGRKNFRHYSSHFQTVDSMIGQPFRWALCVKYNFLIWPMRQRVTVLTGGCLATRTWTPCQRRIHGFLITDLCLVRISRSRPVLYNLPSWLSNHEPTLISPDQHLERLNVWGVAVALCKT